MDELELNLNLSFDEGPQNRNKLGWKERKSMQVSGCSLLGGCISAATRRECLRQQRSLLCPVLTHPNPLFTPTGRQAQVPARRPQARRAQPVLRRVQRAQHCSGSGGRKPVPAARFVSCGVGGRRQGHTQRGRRAGAGLAAAAAAAAAGARVGGCWGGGQVWGGAAAQTAAAAGWAGASCTAAATAAAGGSREGSKARRQPR